jgi:cytochrome P450
MTPFTASAVTVTASCAVVLFLYAIVITIYNLFFHPLAKVPGPKLYAISSLPFINRLIRGQWPFILKNLHDKYGPVVRFTQNDVSFVSSSAWKDIYGHKKAGQLSFDKDKRLYRGSPGILVSDDADHSRIRRLLAHAFSEKALRGQEDIMKHYIALLITKLKNEATEGNTVDMVNWYNFTTFDLIGDLAFGESFGCLESGGYHPWVAMIFGGFRLANYNQALKRLPRLAPFVSWLIPQKLLRHQREHMTLSFEKAKKRAETGGPDRQDFMSYMVRTKTF